MDPADLSLQFEGSGDRLVVRITGDVDVASAPDLEAEVTERLCPGLQVALDLSGVTFLDSCGLRVIMALHVALEGRGGRLVLHQPSPTVVRLLAITGFDSLLDVTDAPP